MLFNYSRRPLQEAFSPSPFYHDDSLFFFFLPVFSGFRSLRAAGKCENSNEVSPTFSGRERVRFEAAKQQSSPRRQWLINKAVGAGREGGKVGSKPGVAAGTCSLQE